MECSGTPTGTSCWLIPRIDRQEMTAVFRQRFPGARRVQVQPFHPETPGSENVENCVGYVFMFEHRDSEYAASRLFLWIRQRAALRSMCSVLRAKVKTYYSPLGALSRSDTNSPSSTFVEPMPVVI